MRLLATLQTLEMPKATHRRHVFDRHKNICMLCWQNWVCIRRRACHLSIVTLHVFGVHALFFVQSIHIYINFLGLRAVILEARTPTVLRMQPYTAMQPFSVRRRLCSCCSFHPLCTITFADICMDLLTIVCQATASGQKPP